MTQGTQQHEQPILVGTSLRRHDGPDKVTGRARYAGDQILPGMLYARLVLGPYAHARLLRIDTSAALSVPGVVAVFTAETLGMAQADPLSRSQSPLAQQEVFWCGHPVAIVVGQTKALAEDGATAIHWRTFAQISDTHSRTVSYVTPIPRCARSSSTGPKTEGEAEIEPDRMTDNLR